MPKKNESIPLEHPGIFLEEEFLKPLNITAYRLAKYFGMSEGFSLPLQHAILELKPEGFRYERMQ